MGRKLKHHSHTPTSLSHISIQTPPQPLPLVDSVQNKLKSLTPLRLCSKFETHNRFKPLFQLRSFFETSQLLLYKPLFIFRDLMFVQKSVPDLFIFCSFSASYLMFKRRGGKLKQFFSINYFLSNILLFL